VSADEKSTLAFVAQPADEPNMLCRQSLIYMLAPGVAFSEPMVTDREKVLDTQSLLTKLEHEVEGLEAKMEKQGKLMQKIKEASDDNDLTNSSQMVERIEESTLEMQKKQKERETIRQELIMKHSCDENKEMQGRELQLKEIKEDLRLDQRYQATLDVLLRQEQKYEAIQQKLHAYKIRDRA
jgi:hypothetical protein